MYWKYFTFIIFILTINNCYGGDTKESCSSIPLVEDFEAEKIAGIWYLQQTLDEIEGRKGCVTYNLTLDNLNDGVTYDLQMTWNDDEGKEDYTKMRQLKNTSEFRLPWRGVMSAVWAIATDYTTYATWFLCIPTEKDGGSLYISTRAKNPSEETIRRSHQAIKDIGFHVNQNRYYIVTHKC